MAETMKPCECGNSNVHLLRTWMMPTDWVECLSCHAATIRRPTRAEALLDWDMGRRAEVPRG